MSGSVREHLRSNIVGYIALFCFAMSGTAVALTGANTVFSDDIVNGEVTAADLASDSVNGGKLRSDSTASRHVVNNSLTANDLGPGSVTAEEIADGTFFGGDIGDTGFGDIEIPDDAIQSNEINDGAVGGADLSVLTTLGPDTTITNDGQLTTLEVSCDTGEKALGGGATNFGAEGVYMTQSSPLPSAGGEVPTGWEVSVENQSGAEQTGNAYAICTQAGVEAEKAGRR